MNSLTYFKKQLHFIDTDLNHNLKLIKDHSVDTHKKEMRYENIMFFMLSFFAGIITQKKMANKKDRNHINNYEKSRFNKSIIKILYTFIETKIIHNLIK